MLRCSAAALAARLAPLFVSPSATRGDTAVEYVILLGVLAIPLIPAFVSVVHGIVRDLDQMQALLLMPFP